MQAGTCAKGTVWGKVLGILLEAFLSHGHVKLLYLSNYLAHLYPAFPFSLGYQGC